MNHTWLRRAAFALAILFGLFAGELRAQPAVTIDSFTASPTTITVGSSSTLSWTTSNASRVDIDNGIGTVALSGTLDVTPSTTTTYTLTAYPSPIESGPPIMSSPVTVTVAPPPQITSFTAAPASITTGQNSTLSWTTQDTGAVYLDGSLVAANDSQVVSPASTTTYRLEAYPSPLTAGPPDFSELTVTVAGAPVTIDSFTANRTTVTTGTSATLSWSTSNASRVDIDNGIGTVGTSGTVDVSPSSTTIYTLSAYPTPFESGPPIRSQVSITVVPPAQIDSFTATPTSIQPGESTTLNWSTQFTSFVFIPGVPSAPSTPTGSVTVSPTETTTYTLVAYPSPPNAGPETTSQVTVNVAGSSPRVSIAFFNAERTTITNGSSVLLNWSTFNASLVTIDNGVGQIPEGGSVFVSPTENTTYTLSAYPIPLGSGPPVTSEVPITVVPAPQIDSFTASQTSIERGERTTLSWSTQFTSFVFIPGVPDAPSSPIGSVTVSPSETTTYTLVAYPSPPNAGPETTSEVTVIVSGSTPGGPPSILSFVADPSTISRGASASLSWFTENSAYVEIDHGVGRFETVGSVDVSPSETTTYTLAAYPAPPATGPPAIHRITVTVTPPPEIFSFTATPSAIDPGELVTLTWTTAFSSFVVISGFGQVEPSGSLDVAPVETTTYTLEAYPSPPFGEPVRRDVTVTVGAAASCPTGEIRLLAPRGDSSLTSPVTFEWSSIDGASGYRVWISVDGSAPIIVASTTSETTATEPIPSGTIDWFVEAELPRCLSILSPFSTFTVQQSTTCDTNQPATLIAPLGPLEDPITVRNPINFSWNAAAGAAGYTVWLSIDGNPFEDIANTGDTLFERDLPAGDYIWYIETRFGGCPSIDSARAAFRIALEETLCRDDAPITISPVTDAVDVTSPVLFLWTAVPDAVEYRLYAGLNGEEPGVIETTTDTSTTKSVPPGTITWFVEAVFATCSSTRSAEAQFAVAQADTCTNVAADLIAPSNGATVASAVVDFSWNAVAGAVSYVLFAKRDDDAETPIGETTDTRLTRTVPAGARIEWWIVTFFSGCNPTESTHFTFIVPETCDNKRPLPLSPDDDAFNVSSPVFFSWTAVPQATSYNLRVAVGDDPFEIVFSGAQTQRSLAISSGVVRWYVEAVFNGCPLTESATSRFTVVPPPAVCGVPGTPEATVAGQVLSGTTYNVRWSGVPSANLYELQESTTSDFLNATTHVVEGVVAMLQHEVAANPQQYSYRVRAVSNCSDERGSYSDVVSVFVTPSRQANGGVEVGIAATVVQTLFLRGAADPVRFSATVDKPWLKVQPDSGILPPEGLTLTVLADPTVLDVGTNSGTVTVSYAELNQSGRRETTATPPTEKSTISVSLVTPVGVGGKNTPAPDSLIIPAVAHLSGANNAAFESDVRIANLSAQTMKYLVNFTPTRQDGTLKGSSTTIQVDAGTTLALDDVLETFFGTGGGVALGTLEVRPLTTSSTNLGASASRVTIASSRTFNATPTGTFGQYIPAVAFSQFVGKGTGSQKNLLSLQQIAQSAAYRTNLGLVEASGEAAKVLLRVFNNRGDVLAEIIEDLKPGEHKQMDRFLQVNNISVEDGRIEVEVLSNTGRVTAYASTVDNRTNDPLLVSPILKNSISSKRFVIPGVALFNNGVADFRTDARLFNAASTPTNATVTYYPQVSTEQVQRRELQLAAGEVKAFDNVLSSLFGLSSTLGGLLAVTTTSNSNIIASARTYNQTSNGTFGQFVPGVTPEESAGLGGRVLHLLQLEQSGRFRTNIGLAETSGQPVRVEIAVYLPDSRVIPRTQVDLPANGFLQKSLADFGVKDVYNVRATVKVLSGPGKITSYASVIDQKTQDPTYVPAQ